MTSSIVGSGNRGVAEHMRAARLMADDEHVGLAAVQQAERHRRIGRVEQRSLALDHVQMVGRSRRASAFRRRRRRSRTPRRPSGCPQPAIMIPVWPVARKLTSSPRACKAASDRQRRIFLAERAIGADRQQPLAAALPAGRNRNVRRRDADVDQAPAERFGRAASCGISDSRACMPDTMSSPASSASRSAGIQCCGIAPPGVATPISSARAPLDRPRPALSCGRPVVTVAPGSAFADAALGRPIAQPECCLGIARSTVSPRNSRYGPSGAVSASPAAPIGLLDRSRPPSNQSPAVRLRAITPSLDDTGIAFAKRRIAGAKRSLTLAVVEILGICLETKKRPKARGASQVEHFVGREVPLVAMDGDERGVELGRGLRKHPERSPDISIDGVAERPLIIGVEASAELRRAREAVSVPATHDRGSVLLQLGVGVCSIGRQAEAVARPGGKRGFQTVASCLACIGVDTEAVDGRKQLDILPVNVESREIP